VRSQSFFSFGELTVAVPEVRIPSSAMHFSGLVARWWPRPISAETTHARMSPFVSMAG